MLYRVIATALLIAAPVALSDAQVTLGADRPFYRFTDLSSPAPDAVNVGWDFWTGLQSAAKPQLAIKVRVPVDAKNTFRLGDALDVAKFSPDAIGVIVAVESVFGRNHHYVVTRGVANAADLRLLALPPSMLNESAQRVKSATVWAREVFAVPREWKSTPITLPAAGATLSFGVGFEDLLEQLGVRTLTDAITGDGRKTFPIIARITAECDGQSKELFAQELRSNTDQANHRRFKHFSMDLAAFAGKAVSLSFRFEPTPNYGDTSAFGIPLWGNPVLLAKDTPSAKKNLLVISLDTLRADHLSAYGYHRATSSNLDAFAAGAMLFEDCLTTASWTTPGHASAFTGLTPVLHGAGGPAGFMLRHSATTLAELARANGYLTAAFTQGFAVSGSFGFTQGFDQYSDGPESGMPATSNGVAGDIFAQGKSWLNEFGRAPFMLFLHTYEIHAPYIPPDAFHGRFAQGEIGKGAPDPKVTDPAERARMEALYDEGIAYTDDELGKFLDYLKKSGLLENTNIVIMSDHGEEFWEHGGVQHSGTLYQEQIHVPLIIRMAGAQPPAGRVAQRVSVTDIFATSLAMLGIEYAAPRDSINLVPLMRDPTAPTPRTLFRFELYKTNKNYFIYAALQGSLKYSVKTYYNRPDSPLYPFVHAAGQPHSPDQIPNAGQLPASNSPLPASGQLAARELALLEAIDKLQQPTPNLEEQFFDLATDPGEQHPLPPNDAMRALRHALLEELRASANETRQRLEAAGLPSQLTDTEREQLRSLGYVD